DGPALGQGGISEPSKRGRLAGAGSADDRDVTVKLVEGQAKTLALEELYGLDGSFDDFAEIDGWRWRTILSVLWRRRLGRRVPAGNCQHDSADDGKRVRGLEVMKRYRGDDADHDWSD